MTDDHEPPPESKLTRSKERWAREGKFLTGKIARPEDQRLPPGQHLTRDWPVLDLGLTPNISRERWRLDVYGAVENPIFWNFARVHRAAADAIPLRHPLRHHMVALRQSMGGAFDPRPPDGLPAARRGRASWCCIRTTATPPTLRWRISPPKTRCSPIAGPASRWSRTMAARCGWWCRISISGRAPNGCRASNSVDKDAPGYWEVRGYHNRGDPWAEQRYYSD